MVKEQLWDEVNAMPVFDTHEHLEGFAELEQENFNLRYLLSGNYLDVPRRALMSWDEYAAAVNTHAGHESLLFNDYAFRTLYGIPLYPATADNLAQLDETVRSQYKEQGPDYLPSFLRDTMHVKYLLHDFMNRPGVYSPFWATDRMAQEFGIRHAFRIDTLMRLETVANPRTSYLGEYASAHDLPLNSMADCEDALAKLLNEYACPPRATCIKIGSAYDQSIDYSFVEEYGSDWNFGANLDIRKLTVEEKRRFSDWMFTQVCIFAWEHKLPVEVHTGLAKIEGSNPLNLVNFMRAFPNVPFDLFHAGYPWSNLMAGILSQVGNAWLDMCWAPIISRDTAIRTLTDVIAFGQTWKTIGFGGDCRSV